MRFTITRKPGWYAKVRKFHLKVDGRKMATIEEGETVTLEVSPEARSLVGTVDWGRSPSFSLQQLNDGDLLEIQGWFTWNPLRNLGLLELPVTIRKVEP